jgi:recombination protein RecT
MNKPALRNKAAIATVQAAFESRRARFAAALGKQMDTDKFLGIAINAFATGSDRFQQSRPESLLAACMQAAQLGLNPDPTAKEFWLIPRRRKIHGEFVQWIDGQVGYKGLIKLARRNPNFRAIKSELVRERDDFEVMLGSEPYLRHRPDLMSEQASKLRCTYAVVYYRDGSSLFHVSPMHEITLARSRSESFSKWGKGPWKDYFESMALLVPMRKLLANEHIDAAVTQQLDREDRQESSEEAVIDTTIAEDLDLDAPGEEPPAKPETVEQLKIAARQDRAPDPRPEVLPTKKGEPPYMETARRSIRSLRQMGYSTEEMYRIATGIDTAFPTKPEKIECFAVVQLASVCEHARESGSKLPTTHADFYALGSKSPRPMDHPFYRDGELTENATGLLK